ncbi:hypothetical protein PVA44_05080 [Entomospira nematocerorum]|uniref:Outer membrane protein beta-barrel domain-containing protein n=1 Tax=Entomospira nematocerorum TaxID=2719987 RepID=A0A968KSI8_9SPIO|nr:hypothetical protein [Entomospira nematocera]NIZ46605.1 hypothetical protein [Entomospira nematocera]WDI33597.1 hypothetical protein PVA44_05080 [Entomospira nematocera]
MKKVFFPACLLAILISTSFAYDNPEVSLGIRLGGEAYYSFAPLANLETGEVGIFPQGLGGNFAFSLLADIHAAEWLAFTPGFTMSVSRFTTDKEANIRANWQEFNLDFLIKFFVSYWYIAAGPGIAITTAPVYHTRPNYINSNIGNVGDSIASMGITPKVSTRFIVTLDTGVYIPLGKSEVGYITVSWRTTFAPVLMDKLYSMTKARTPEVAAHYLELLSNRSSSLLSSGLFIGFSYILG